MKKRVEKAKHATKQQTEESIHLNLPTVVRKLLPCPNFYVLRLRNVYMEFIYVLRRLRLKFTIKIFHIFNQILRVEFLLYNRSNSILNGKNNFLQQRTHVKELHIT